MKHFSRSFLRYLLWAIAVSLGLILLQIWYFRFLTGP